MAGPSVRCLSCGHEVDSESARLQFGGGCPKCLGAFALDAVQNPGISIPPERTFGKYQLERRLGKGGMGEVWKAFDEELKRWVALKFPTETGPQEAARFQREARTAAALTHPGIAAIYEVGEIEGRRYIAMQYVEGTTLQHHPRSDRKGLARLVCDAARALEHAHRHGVIHRDLKPENLMVEKGPEGDRVILLDFGLAKPIQGGERLSQTGTVAGTLAYMSPEQASGGPLDERADVYSLGATLYDVLTGRPPFPGENYLDVLKRIENEDPAPLRRLNPHIPRDLETIVLKCLEKTPGRRYPNARDLADDLDRFLEGDAIKARPASAFYRLRMKLVKRKAVVATALVGLLGILIVAGMILGSHDRLAEARAQAATHVDLARLKIDQLDQLLNVDEDRNSEIEKLASGARAELTEALRLCPEHEEACFEMGSLHAALRRTDGALEFFTRAIQLAPRQAKSYLGRAALNLEIYENLMHIAERRHARKSDKSRKVLAQVTEDLKKVRSISTEVPQLKYAEGMVLFAEGKFAAAAGALGEYLKLAPGDASGWLWHGHALSHTPASAEAVQSLTRALKIQPRMPGAHILRGMAQYDLERYDAAIADFTRAIELDPKSAVARSNLGNAKDRKGLFDEAIADHTKAIELDPAYADAYRNRANAKGDKSHFDEAIADYTRAIELDPSDSTAYSNRGIVKAKKGLPDEAIADHTRAIELDAENAAAYNNRGAILHDVKKDPDAAIRDFTKAIELEPLYAGAYRNRGLAKSDKSLHDEAIADFTKAIEIEPKLADVHLMRAGSKRHKGLLDEAIADCSKAIEIEPGSATAYYDRGFLKSAKGLHDEAIVDFTKAIELSPKYAWVFYDRGKARRAQGQLELAIADYTAAIALDPRHARAYLRRGTAQEEAGRIDDAEADFNKAIEIDPAYAEAYVRRGVLRTDIKRLYDKGIEDFTKAIALEPKNAVAWFNRGLAKRQKGLTDEAIADYSEAIRLDPKEARSYSSRGIAKSFKGLHDEAIADYDKAIERNPKYSCAYHHRGASRAVKGDVAGGIQDCLRAVELNPELPCGFGELETTCYKSIQEKRFQPAIDAFLKALEFPLPKNLRSNAAYGLACAHALMGDKGEALDWLEEAAKLGFKDVAHLEKDDDLDSLRGEERYKKLVLKLKEY